MVLPCLWVAPCHAVVTPYKRIVLNGGDKYPGHSGGKGGLKMGKAHIRPIEENTPPMEEELPLENWKSWLDSEDTSKWWPDD